MDLCDDDGLLNNGRVWLQVDDIDVKLWLGKWMQDNVVFQMVCFSLEGWMMFSKGEIVGGDIWLKQGGVSWLGDNMMYMLFVDNLMVQISCEQLGWQFYILDIWIMFDGKFWLSGVLIVVWFLQQDVGGENYICSDELCICVSNFELVGLEVLCLLVVKLLFVLGEIWQVMQLSGKIVILVLDILLQVIEKMCFQVLWENFVWKQWKLLFGVEYFFGMLVGSVEDGQMKVVMQQVKMFYEIVFCVLLEIENGVVMFSWLKNENGFQFDGCDIDVKVKVVYVCGGFCYL